MAKDKRRDRRAYRRATERLKQRAKRHGWVCYYCKRPFDWSLPYHHREAFTADHVQPLAKDGAILGPLRPAHRHCNSRRNDGRHEDRVPTTRQW